MQDNKGFRDPKESLMRSDEAWKVKDFWESIHRECYDLALAGMSPYTAGDKQPKPMNKQFDSTAPNAVVRLANRIVNDMTPPYDSWVNVSAGPVLERQLGKAELEELKEKLSGVNEIANLVINQRELVAARYTGILDLVIAGFGVILNLEDGSDDINPISSQSVSQSEVAISEDGKGRVDGVYRKRSGVKVSHIKGIWDDAEIPDVIESMKGKDKDPEIDLIEVTYAIPGGNKQGSNLPPWAYEVFYINSNKDPVRLVQRGYNENPWTIWRWLTLPGCPYGPGPVMLALSDIRVANKIVEMVLKNAALALSGMYLVKDDGVINPDNVQITNAGMIPVAHTGGTVGASMVPLETGRSFDVGQLVLDQYQARIKKWLFDNGLPPQDATPRSATEIINRIREITQDLGAGIGRLAGDLVDYVRRIISILIRRGMIPFDIKMDQFTFKIQINSPLARAQQLQQVQTVIQWLETVMQIGGEQALTVVAKIPEILVWIAEQMGVPAQMINSEAEQAQAQESLATIQAAGTLGGDPAAALPA